MNFLSQKLEQIKRLKIYYLNEKQIVYLNFLQ